MLSTVRIAQVSLTRLTDLITTAEHCIVFGRFVCPFQQGILVETYLRSGQVTKGIESKLEQLLDYGASKNRVRGTYAVYCDKAV